MALPVYQYDSIPTDLEFNAFLRPVFDKDEAEEEFPGHLHRLRDTSLSNDATQIKGRFTKFEGELQVTAGAGLSVNIAGGQSVLLNGTRITITAASLAIPNNSVVFVYVTESGTFAQSTLIPLKGLVLARVTTVAGAITSIEDLRPRFQVQPLFSATKIFGGSGDEGDYTLASGTATLDLGQYYFRNFTVSSGATLTVLGGVEIYCSGNVSIQGVINVTPLIVGGGATNAGFAANTFGGGSPGAGPGAGSGFVGGSTYSYILAPHGSGGAQGRILAGTTGLTVGFFAQGGKGGGLIKIEAGGTISVTGQVNCKGDNGGTANLTTFDAESRASGAGGGSGGLILFKSLSSITASGTSTLDVRGGQGGNGVAVGAGGNPGGGGGGGYVVLIAPTVNTTGANILLTGGAIGTNTSTGSAGLHLAGTAGGGFAGSGGSTTSSSTAGSAGRLVVRNFLSVA